MRAAGAQQACRRQVVGADLTGPWQDALIGAGFDAQTPSVWLLEGFLFYIPSASITHILDALTLLAAPGSRLGFDIINRAVLTSPYTKAWIDMQAASGALWIGAMDDPVAFLAQRGWTAHLSAAGEPEANHGRWKLPSCPPPCPVCRTTGW